MPARLRQRREALDKVIDQLGTGKERAEDRLHELEVAEKIRVLRSRAATGGERRRINPSCSSHATALWPRR